MTFGRESESGEKSEEKRILMANEKEKETNRERKKEKKRVI